MSQSGDVIDVGERAESSPGPRAPRAGDRRWSAYFNSHIILTRYFNDSLWFFYRETDPSKVELRAQARWTVMPRPVTPRPR